MIYKTALTLIAYLVTIQAAFGQTKLRRTQDTTIYLDSLILLYNNKLANRDDANAVFIPEIEDILEDLIIHNPEMDFLNTNRYENQKKNPIYKYKIINVMRLPDSEKADNVINKISRYYESASLNDPNRSKVYKEIKPFIDYGRNMLEVKINLIENILFFEFIRFDISQGGVGSTQYKSSATGIINLGEVRMPGVKEEFENAIYKIFPSTNQRPEAFITTNGKRVGDEYFFGVGDTIRVSGRSKDYDTPEEDLSFNWRESSSSFPSLPINANQSDQVLVINDTGSFTLELKVNDRINFSEPVEASFNIIQTPKIDGIWFSETQSKVAKAYFWNFNGRPYYYTDRNPDVHIVLDIDDQYRDTTQLRVNVSLENGEEGFLARRFAANAVKTNETTAELQFSDFQLEYNNASVLDSSEIRGQLRLPKVAVPSREYVINTGLSHYGINTSSEQYFVVEMNRIRKFSIYSDLKFGLLPFQDSLRFRDEMFNYTYRTTQFNLGLSYKVTPRVSILLLPGIFIIPQDNWEFTGRLGLEYDAIALNSKLPQSVGLGISGNYAGGIYNGQETRENIFFISGSAYFKTYLNDKPESILKLGIYFDLMDQTFVSDMFGLTAGIIFHTFGKKSKSISQKSLDKSLRRMIDAFE